MTRALFHLSGTIRTGTREMDETMGYTTLEAAQRALGMGDAVTQVGILAPMRNASTRLPRRSPPPRTPPATASRC
jgi:ABC-type lipoprotein release transport system permease subunit